MTTINYTMPELMERLGTEATIEDAEAAMERAEDWYNRTPKADVLAWYESHRLDNQHAQDISDPDEAGMLIDDWATVVIFHRAASLIDAATDIVTIGRWTGPMAAARELMDDELCEAIHGTVDTEQEFADAYCEAHLAKYGTDFVVS